jgi:hypothetical protein
LTTPPHPLLLSDSVDPLRLMTGDLVVDVLCVT